MSQVVNPTVPFSSEPNAQGGLDIIGIAGENRLNGSNFNDLITTFDAADTVDAGLGDDRVILQGGDDVFLPGLGNDLVMGGAGDDTIDGGAGSDILSGGLDDDSISGGTGNDLLLGDLGDDTLSGDQGDDQIYGGKGNDIISGGAGSDQGYGGPGRDTLEGDGGNDQLFGNEGNDILSGGAGDDRLHGGIGGDQLHGGSGEDTLRGAAGDDTLRGGTGNDVLMGDGGDDLLIGGAGADTFRFEFFGRNAEPITGPESGNPLGRDRIADFDPREDIIQLDRRIFAAIEEEGTLAPRDFARIQNFRPGSSSGRNARVIYDPASGLLYYNPTGTAGDEVVVVQLDRNLRINNTNFEIF